MIFVSTVYSNVRPWGRDDKHNRPRPPPQQSGPTAATSTPLSKAKRPANVPTQRPEPPRANHHETTPPKKGNK
eukprot:204789-Amphidinium_carterae.1